MNIVDVCIVCTILLIALSGFRRGVFKQAVITIGSIFIFVLAYKLKDPLANFFSYNLPFFNFKGDFLGLSTINIIVYQMLAFLIVLSILSVILGIIIKITGLFETILKFTVVLSIPSKILGFFLGLIEGYLVIFIVLFFLNQPAMNIDILNESKYMPKIINNSFGLSSYVKKTNDSINEIYKLGKDYVLTNDSNTFNKNAIDVMLKNKIITVDYVETLISKGKINIIEIDEILNKYR